MKHRGNVNLLPHEATTQDGGLTFVLATFPIFFCPQGKDGDTSTVYLEMRPKWLYQRGLGSRSGLKRLDWSLNVGRMHVDILDRVGTGVPHP